MGRIAVISRSLADVFVGFIRRHKALRMQMTGTGQTGLCFKKTKGIVNYKIIKEA